MASVWGQLKRRNVVRVAVAYAIAIWLILQLTDLLIPLLGLPERAGKPVLLLLVVEFPLETVGTTSLTVSLIVHRTAVRALQKRFEDIHIETEESVALIRFPQSSENVLAAMYVALSAASVLVLLSRCSDVINSSGRLLRVLHSVIHQTFNSEIFSIARRLFSSAIKGSQIAPRFDPAAI